MKKLDISQLLELCREAEIDDQQALLQDLFAILEQLSEAAASKLGVTACGVEYSRYGLLARFSPRSPGDVCPPALEALDDEGAWQQPSPRTLLICDDNHHQTSRARHALSHLGVHVIEAHSTEEAWQAYQSNRVNLVITDTALQGQDSCQLLRNIVSLEERRGNRRKVPVITLSGDAANASGAEALNQSPGLTQLTKPINWHRLGPVIGELCQAL